MDLVVTLVLKYGPSIIKDAAWFIRFKRWRDAKAAAGQLDSQRDEGGVK